MQNIIEFISNDEIAAKNFPPLPANKIIPEWFKKLPLLTDNDEFTAKKCHEYSAKKPMSIKHCMPVNDYMTSGYVIRSAADIVITPEKEGIYKSFTWCASEPFISAHKHEQCPIHIQKEKNHYIKILSNWRIKTALGYSCYIYQHDFFINDEMKLFPGIVDTDTYSNSINFPGVVTAKSTFLIKAGDPLMVVFPFKREDWAHKILIKEEPKNPLSRFLERGYKTLFHSPKHYR
jgi:hypothetical protein